MKKVILAVLALAFALFLILPNLAWAQDDLYKAKCAGCHGPDGKGTAAGKKMGALEFSSPAVQKMSDAASLPTTSKTAVRRRKLRMHLPTRALARPMRRNWRLT